MRGGKDKYWEKKGKILRLRKKAKGGGGDKVLSEKLPFWS